MSKVYYKIGDKEITFDQVHQFIHDMGQDGMRFHNEEGFKKIAEELLNQELFYLDALENRLDKREEYLEEVEYAKQQILKQFAIKELLSNVKLSENQVRDFYEENKHNFTDVYKFRASHILVDSEDKANSIKKEIEEGKDFEELAKENSSCPSSKNGGDLGDFQSGQMVKEFEQELLNMNNGEISNPVKTQFGYHIIKLNNKTLEKENNFENFRHELERSLLNQLKQETYVNKAKELKSKYKVEGIE